MPTTRTLAVASLLAAGSLGADAMPDAEDRSAPLTIRRAESIASAKGATPDNFTGAVRVDMLQAPTAPGRASAAAVTFEPGARTVWHTHPLGQILIVTTGVGRVQRAGAPVETIRPGDVVWIPPQVRHWHGAAPTTAMTHIAITEALDGKAVDWLEPVTPDAYGE